MTALQQRIRQSTDSRQFIKWMQQAWKLEPDPEDYDYKNEPGSKDDAKHCWSCDRWKIGYFTQTGVCQSCYNREYKRRKKEKAREEQWQKTQQQKTCDEQSA
jgi:hypothetical protein